MKKSIVFITLITLFILSLVGIFYMLERDRPDDSSNDSNDYLEFKVKSDNIIISLALNLIRPLIISRIDYFIEKNGLMDKIKRIDCCKSRQAPKKNYTIYDINTGNGKTVLCGQEVKLVIYEILYDSKSSKPSPNSILNHNTSDINHTSLEMNMLVGSHAIKEINNAVIGMKEGGERVVVINTGDVNKIHSYYLKLNSVNTTFPKSVQNLMIFNDYSNISNNEPSEIGCGDKVSVKYRVRNHNGELVHNDQKVSFTVGHGEVPLALELGVLNMVIGSKRSVIAPPDLINNIINEQNSIAIIDIEIE